MICAALKSDGAKGLKGHAMGGSPQTPTSRLPTATC
jgi:hypothetical protein